MTSVILLLTVAFAYFPRHESAIINELAKKQADPRDVPTEELYISSDVSSYRKEVGSLRYHHTEKERLLVESEYGWEINRNAYNTQHPADNNGYALMISSPKLSTEIEKQFIRHKAIRARNGAKAPPVKRGIEMTPKAVIPPTLLKSLAFVPEGPAGPAGPKGARGPPGPPGPPQTRQPYPKPLPAPPPPPYPKSRPLRLYPKSLPPRPYPKSPPPRPYPTSPPHPPEYADFID